MVLELIHGSLVGSPTYQMFSKDGLNRDDATSSECQADPMIAGVAESLATQDGKVLDKKQYITYEMVCCTFLLELLNEALDPTSSVHRQMAVAISLGNILELIDNLKEHLLARGGMDQMLLFLTKPVGVDKTTAIKASERFCFEFCLSCNIMWTDTSFFYTAYTGSAASTFRG